MSSGSGLFALFGFDFESWSIIQIWSRQWLLKEKNAYFKLTCVAYERRCLNSLLILTLHLGQNVVLGKRDICRCAISQYADPFFFIDMCLMERHTAGHYMI